MWYRKRSPDAAARFLLALKISFQKIIDQAARHPTYLLGTRFVKVRRFPYLVVFHVQEPVARIIAVAHGRRRPGYWQKRMK